MNIECTQMKYEASPKRKLYHTLPVNSTRTFDTLDDALKYAAEFIQSHGDDCNHIVINGSATYFVSDNGESEYTEVGDDAKPNTSETTSKN